MKKTIILVIISLFLLFFAGNSRAAYVTSGNLLKKCESDNRDDLFSCMNYIAGVIDYHIFMQSLGTQPITDFCLPDNISIEKASVVVIAYLKETPQHAPFIAAPAVLMALNKEYPCAPAKSAK